MQLNFGMKMREIRIRMIAMISQIKPALEKKHLLFIDDLRFFINLNQLTIQGTSRQSRARNSPEKSSR
jgi:hypothetical protein